MARKISSEGLLRGHGGGGRSDLRWWEGVGVVEALKAAPVEMRLVKRRILVQEGATIVPVWCNGKARARGAS